MKKNLTIDDFTPRRIRSIKSLVILWDELESKMGKKRFKEFKKWIHGQTCTPSGVYQEDLERYLKGADSFRY